MFEEVEPGRHGKRAKKKLSRRGRKYVYGIALAALPLVTAAGIITEETAALYATLLGAILVPWLGLVDTVKYEQDNQESYERGLDEGYDAARGNDRGEKWQN